MCTGVTRMRRDRKIRTTTTTITMTPTTTTRTWAATTMRARDPTRCRFRAPRHFRARGSVRAGSGRWTSSRWRNATSTARR